MGAQESGTDLSDNWRNELRQRLSEHSSRKKRGSTGSQDPTEEEAEEEEASDPRDEPRASSKHEVPSVSLTRTSQSGPEVVSQSAGSVSAGGRQGDDSGRPAEESVAEKAAAGVAPVGRPRVIKLDQPAEKAGEGRRLRFREAPATPASEPKAPGRTRKPLSNPVREKESAAELQSGKGKVFEGPLERVGGPGEKREVSSVRPRPLPLGEIGSSASGRPRQRILNLDAAPEPQAESAGVEFPDEGIQAPPAGLLLSRALCGVIDLTLALVLGIVFMLVAAELIGFDFFAPAAVIMTVLVAMAFQLFNSAFFFFTAGHTPGMAAARLRLVSEDSEEDVPAGAVVLRVVTFLPALASVVGLLWSLFDPERRCAHDILSGTRVCDEPGR